MGAGSIGITGRMVDKRTTQVEKSKNIIGHHGGWVMLDRYSADLAGTGGNISDVTFTIPAAARGYKVYYVTFTEYKPMTDGSALMIDADVGGGYTDAYLGDAKWYIGHNNNPSTNSGAGWNSGNGGSSDSNPGNTTGNAQNAMRMTYTGEGTQTEGIGAGIFTLYNNPSSTAYTKNWINQSFTFYKSGSYWASIKYGGGGYWNEAGNTISEIKLTTSSGNIKNGIFTLYAAK